MKRHPIPHPIVRRREFLLLTRKALADTACVKYHHLSRIETGTVPLDDPDMATRIAAALNVEPSVLIEEIRAWFAQYRKPLTSLMQSHDDPYLPRNPNESVITMSTTITVTPYTMRLLREMAQFRKQSVRMTLDALVPMLYESVIGHAPITPEAYQEIVNQAVNASKGAA